ncbi:MAG: efflux RND transporter periplasmic adaptor subunit [Prevotella sp.]|nr:efflux RND transporter periplasmic adaptor subunit [Prevotella sp.]
MRDIRILLLLSWVVGFTIVSCSKEEKPQRESVVNVKTMTVETSTHAVGKIFMGVVEEEDGANVTFNVIGNVIKVMVEEGQFVRKGQPMAEVDGENVRNAYKISQSTLRQTEDAYQRMKNLYDKGTLPEIRMVEIESALTSARASEAISKKNVEDIILRAPFDGYVASRAVHVGASVMPGVTGFRLVKIERVKVNLSVPEKEIGKVKMGQQVMFTINALGDRMFGGKVVNRGVTADPISHAYSVKALVDNRSHTLLPGMVCKVRIDNTQGNYAIVVPQQAIQISGQDKYVWIVRGGQAHRRSVTTGDVISEGVVVETGLTAGDIVITQGQNKVCEGTTVKTE